jgi:hypothetical protein
MSPRNCCGGGGHYLPPMVVVAPGAPGVAVASWAIAGAEPARAPATAVNNASFIAVAVEVNISGYLVRLTDPAIPDRRFAPDLDHVPGEPSRRFMSV